MPKRALLANPPTGLYIREDRCQAPLSGMAATTARPPLDLAYMAATMEQAGIECRIADYPVEGGGWDEFRCDLCDFKPDFLFISVTSFTVIRDMLACRIAKEVLGAKVITVAKGAHVSVRARETLLAERCLDVVIRGEYETAAREIATADNLGSVAGLSLREGKSGEIISTPDRPFLADLDILPFPARHLLANELYQRPDTGAPQTTVQTGRGCPGGCIFCLAPEVYGSRVRLRTPRDVTDELEQCVKRFDIRDFFFRADTFTWDREWVLALCDEIMRRRLKIQWLCNSRVDTIDDTRLERMKGAGCHGVAFGIESGTQTALTEMGKGTTLQEARAAVAMTRNRGMKTLLYFVIGLPWETEEDIARTVDFAAELGGDLIEIHAAIPFPGTKLEALARREGLLQDESLEGTDYSRAPLRTRHISVERLRTIRRRALLGLYLRPSVLIRMLAAVFREARSPGQLWRILRFGTGKLASLAFARDESR